MNIRRTLSFTKRTLNQFRHDKRTLVFVMVVPLLMMLIFGYTFGGEVKNVEVAVVDQDAGLTGPMSMISPLKNTTLAEKVIAALDTDTLDIRERTSNTTANADVRDGNLWAVIEFPEDFSVQFLRYLMSNQPDANARPQVRIYIDGSNPNIAGAVFKSVNEAILSAITRLAKDMNQSSIEIPIEIPIEIIPTYAYGGPDTEFIEYFAPGIICFAIMMVTTMLTIILFVNERRTGTLQRLLASPASETEIVIGYALAFGVLCLFQVIVILLVATLIFDITIAGNLILVLAVALLLGVGHQGLGILLSSAAKNELQAVQFIPLVFFPSILLAGLFWPIESIPSFLQPLSYVVPLRYGIDAERSIMLRGWGITGIWLEVAILIGFAVMTLGVSILLLKRRRE